MGHNLTSFTKLAETDPAVTTNLTTFEMGKLKNFRQKFKMIYNPNMNGNEVYFNLYHSEKLIDISAYNNWNFSINTMWDEFFFDETNSRIYRGTTFDVGEDCLY